jgi:hypothetical protein
MSVRQPRYTKAEFARRGDEIYHRDIRPQVEGNHKGRFVALDIETGAWEMDADALAACDRLIARIPDCQTWLVRLGYESIHRLGGPRHS